MTDPWPEKPVCPECKSGTIRSDPKIPSSIAQPVCDYCGHEPLSDDGGEDTVFDIDGLFDD